MNLDPALIAESETNYEGPQPIPPILFVEGEPTADIWLSARIEVADAVRTGIWVGNPGKINVPAYPCDEVFTVITGSIVLTSPNGRVVEVGPGHSCLLRKGWAGTWHTVVLTRKCFVTFNA
jgi:uncharacterized protein